MNTIYKSIKIFLATVLLFSAGDLFAQTDQQIDRLHQITTQSSMEWQQQRAEAETMASELGIPVKQTLPDGTVVELQKFENGVPVYNITHNRNAVEASLSNELWPGGSAGLNLTGMGRTLGMWDGGLIRESHQEFGGRAVQQDGATDLSDHATHVGGTMIAAGVVNSARGVAYEADLDAYDWSDDASEMAAAAGAGLIISNHSYGTRMGWECDEPASVCNDSTNDELWKWYGDPNISETEDFKFGFYNSQAEIWDDIVYNAPNYVIVKSAGNDRNDVPSSQPIEHEVWDSDEGWVTSTTERDPDGDYMSMGNRATAKNIITAGAVHSNTNMSVFSSWGPTNDGRIKPDIVATGVGLNSPLSDADDSYASFSGTSMSSPVISGSISLLQQHYNMLNSDFPRASTIRALVIHSADNLDGEGPNYRNGWGMLNTQRAAEVITENSENAVDHIQELTLNEGQTYEHTVWSDGQQPLRTTIAWTDPAGEPVAPAIDADNRMLMNDLDLRLIDENGNEYEPYILFPDDPAHVALRGDNDRDNVEQVYIETPETGFYTLRVTHKDNLQGGSQDFALVVTGNDDTAESEPGFLTLSDTGEQGYASTPSNTFNSVSGDHITIEFWVNMDADSDQDAVIVSKKSSDEGSSGYRVRTVGDGEERRIRFSPTSSTLRHVTSRSGVRAGEWTHIAAVYNDGDAFIYINGELDAENNNSSRSIGGTGGNDLTIGSNTNRTGQFFRGSVDDLRIWGISRSMFDIRADFTDDLDGDESGLRVYYPFNQESINTSSDATGLGSDLTFVNITGTEGPGVFPVSPLVYGKIADQSVELKISERGFAEDVAAEYRIYRTENGNRTEVATIASAEQFYTDTGLSNGQTYFYEVTIIDGEGHEGDYSNPVALTPNQRIGGTSLKFENQGFIEFSNRPNLSISGSEVTVQFWIKRDRNSSGTQAVVTNENEIGDSGYGLYLIDGGEEARIEFTPTSSSLRHVTSSSGIRADEWTHVTAVYNDGSAQIYINGELDAENVNSSRSISSSGNNLTIGSNTENNAQFFQGELDELRIWNHRRTNTDIQQDFNQVLWGDEEGLAGYWRFDASSDNIVYGQAMRPATSEGTGTVVHDEDGVFPLPPAIYAKPDGENITLFVDQHVYANEDVQSFNIYRNSDTESRTLVVTLDSDQNFYTDNDISSEVDYFYDATITDSDGGESDETYPVSAAVYEDRPGGQAVRFDANQSSYIQFEYNPALSISGNSITVEAWVRKDGASQEGAVILGNNSGGSSGYSLALVDDGASSRVAFTPTSSSIRHVTSSTSLEPDTWYHVAGVYQDGDSFIYINGALDNTRSNSSRSIGNSSHGLVVGANHLGSDNYFIGDVDEVRIWHESLDGTLIQEYFDQPLMGNEENLIGYWRFDETGGEVAYGSAQRPMHGQLINGPQFVSSEIFEGDPFRPMLATPEHEAEDQEVPLTFEWHPVDNAVHYELEISRNQGFSPVILEREIPDTTTTIDMGLEYDSTYYWRVRAMTGQFHTNWSEVWSFTTELPVPETPEWEPADGEEDVPTSLTLAWTESERAETYRVQMSTDHEFSSTLIDSAGIEQTVLDIDNLDASTTYYWRVLASNRTGESNWSDTLEFTTVATSIGNQVAGIPADYQLNQNYPNPFNPTTKIEFALPVAAEVRLEVFDVIGNRVAVLVNRAQKQAGWHEVTFDASNLSSGLYIYRIQAGSYAETKKLTLIK